MDVVVEESQEKYLYYVCFFQLESRSGDDDRLDSPDFPISFFEVVVISTSPTTMLKIDNNRLSGSPSLLYFL